MSPLQSDYSGSWAGKTILLTGGTGSFGRSFLETLLDDYDPAQVIVFSRDEQKHADLRAEMGKSAESVVTFMLGDVRDEDRVGDAMQGVDIVVHAAAMKQLPTCEIQPYEAVKTNILGSVNIIRCAQAAGVRRVLALSTDKAASPVSAYGATKLVSEKLFIAANRRGRDGTLFSCVRYGNVFGSRGSVVPIFLKQAPTGKVRVTDRRMTRFCLTLAQSVEIVLRCLNDMRGGEVFVPKAPTMRLVDLVEAIAPGCAVETIGVRPGERIHELLISEDEARRTVEFGDMYVIAPDAPSVAELRAIGGRPLRDGFQYTSNDISTNLTPEELRALAAAEDAQPANYVLRYA